MMNSIVAVQVPITIGSDATKARYSSTAGNKYQCQKSESTKE